MNKGSLAYVPLDGLEEEGREFEGIPVQGGIWTSIHAGEFPDRKRTIGDRVTITIEAHVADVNHKGRDIDKVKRSQILIVDEVHCGPAE
jgi:hypothetical protein